jgi:hypothetical protein
MTKAHYRTEQAGLRLVHHVAPAVTAALDLYQNKRDAADGMKAPGETAGRGGSDETSTTEAAAAETEKWDLKIEEINDTIESIEISVGHLAKLTIGIDRTPAAGWEKRCRDGQQGRDAVLWSDDTDCAELGAKLEMCGRHYVAYYRFRVSRHLPVDQYFEKPQVL